MRNIYYLNKDNSSSAIGEHEVHRLDCSYLPSKENQIFLGLFDSCTEAIVMAKRLQPSWKIDGCMYCSSGCHKY